MTHDPLEAALRAVLRVHEDEYTYVYTNKEYHQKYGNTLVEWWLYAAGDIRKLN